MYRVEGLAVGTVRRAQGVIWREGIADKEGEQPREERQGGIPVRVLVVDDSVVMRMIIERGLRHAGLGDAEICHAGNGMEALAQMERVRDRGESFDLIFTDVHMPVMNGLELLAEVSARVLGATRRW